MVSTAAMQKQTLRLNRRNPVTSPRGSGLIHCSATCPAHRPSARQVAPGNTSSRHVLVDALRQVAA